MDEKNDSLVAFLAREHEAMANSRGDCPDENVWAALESGLLSPARRDELVAHARECYECRRKMSGIVADWDASIIIPSSSRDDEADRSGILFRIGPRHYAMAAAILLGVTLWLAWPSGGPDVSILGTPIARLTDFGDIGITQRRTLSGNQDSDREAVAQLSARLEKLANAHPDDADAWHDLALAQLRLGKPGHAADSLKKALRLNPNEADWHNFLGMIEYRAGRFELARESFSEAIRRDPNNAGYHLNAALALEELQRIDEAIEHWQTFLRLAPDDVRADEVKKWISVLQGGTKD